MHPVESRRNSYLFKQFAIKKSTGHVFIRKENKNLRVKRESEKRETSDRAKERRRQIL